MGLRGQRRTHLQFSPCCEAPKVVAVLHTCWLTSLGFVGLLGEKLWVFRHFGRPPISGVSLSGVPWKEQ